MVERILLLQEEMLDYNKNISMKVRNRKILINNLIIQASVGVYEYEKKNFSKAYKMFQVLKGLLNEGTQEYNEIRNKILEMEK